MAITTGLVVTPAMILAQLIGSTTVLATVADASTQLPGGLGSFTG